MVTQTAERAAAIHWETRLFSRPTTPAAARVHTPSVTVDDLVEEARATYQRMSPRAAYQLVLHGRAVLVDIRPEAQRRAEGEVDPALRPVVIERTSWSGGWTRAALPGCPGSRTRPGSSSCARRGMRRRSPPRRWCGSG